ncbi:hypothetical protein PsYK624_068080 [Phanerochaete sordida]|uniref:BTB domain-containing protein n=1 Tax=Phanerochaete sordida TaxID=48140 RepID=A0A9P3GB72_9APHY|nr:hypothetical protein PsYK624_068080 [Phanerochaete sordida]
MTSLSDDEPIRSSPSFPTVVLADVILRSSDDVEFRMCKGMLAQASPVFAETIARLSASDAEKGVDERVDDLPMIPVAEPAADLELLLHFCLPRAPPDISDLSCAVRLLESAKKYRVEWALDCARAAFVQLAEDEPIRAYAIACRLNLEDEAREAARLCLRIPLATLIDSEVEEIGDIGAKAFKRLLVYRQTCASVVVGRIASWAWVDALCIAAPDTKWLWFSDGCCDKMPVNRTDYTGRREVCKKWWDTYMKGVAEKLRSCTWEGAVSSRDGLQHFLRSKNCYLCRAGAAEHIDQFTENLRAEIAAQISTIPYVFDPSLP